MDIQPSSQYYIGATVVSNGTAELQAAIEALYYLLSLAIGARRRVALEPQVCLGDSVIFHPDSTYVVGICNNKFAIRENIAAARLLKHLWKIVGRFFMLECVWTKAHANDHANNWVDALADFGTQPTHFPIFISDLSFWMKNGKPLTTMLR